MRSKLAIAGALAVTAALGLAACSGPRAGGSGARSGGGSGARSGGAVSTANAAVGSVVNASDDRGGTMTFDLAGAPDSTDYQNTYSLYMWDFVRLYSMSLLTYKSCPGACGLQLVPDLATGLGTPGDGNRVWTYHLRPDVKFQNGDAVTAADVKYGIERTYARRLLPSGPIYYQLLLQDQAYPGPYVNRAANLMGLTSVTTPNPSTVVFHLNQPFSDFNYVVASPQSTPVEPAWDTAAHGGASFELDPESTGPYEFQRYALNRQLTLVPNPHWNAATDPQARQLASKIIVNMNVSQPAVDRNVLANRAQMDIRGLGLQTVAKEKILASAALHKESDNPVNGFARFAYINSAVVPDVHCREAIEYAADKTTLQAAYGGPVGGQIASTVLPPTILGYQQFDLYNAVSDPTGDSSAARLQLRQCGKAGGFSVSIAYRTDTAGDPQAASALRTALQQVGINATLAGFPTAKYYTEFAGAPAYVHSHDIGIAIGGWSADWPDGFGFLYDLADGAAISPAFNLNIAEINDPVINHLFTQAASDTDTSSLLAIWPKIDRRIMADAEILPIVYQKVLLYRNPDVTNVYLDEYYGMYNYAVLGLR